MGDELHRWTYDPHVHVDPGCKWPRCGRASDGSLDGEPYCFEHAELVVDRWAAITEWPHLANTFTPLHDR